MENHPLNSEAEPRAARPHTDDWRDRAKGDPPIGPFSVGQGGATFLQTPSLHPVFITPESVLSAKPVEGSRRDDRGRTTVITLWLKGDRNVTHVLSTWEEFEAWRFERYAP